ncbi:MAG: metal ABC transporter ATP-binding protein [Pseudomonadota bacterium]
MNLALATQNGQRADNTRTLRAQSAALSIQGLTVSYGSNPVVFSLDAAFEPGRMTAIIGPNGAGKSTTLKACLGLVPKLSGEVRFFGRPLRDNRARVAYVPQRNSVDWAFPARVADVVAMGLYPGLGLLGRFSGAHRATVAEALSQMGMEAFAERQIGQLSGGQQQRVFLARALAQRADLYLLDEPLAGVDAATETAIVSVLHKLRDEGKAIVAVHHDLSTVPEYFDDALVINRRAIAAGPVAQSVTQANLQEAYGHRLGPLDA